MATPVARTFSVFKDASPPSSPSKSSPPSPTITPFVNGSLIVFCPDKENIDPFTGRRSTTESTTKKRKTTAVLVTKSLAPSKKHKELKDSKKRTSSSSSTTVSLKGRTSTEKKSKRVLGSRRTGAGPSRSRRELSLPPVEEAAESEKESERVVQSQIDSRCYDLTVSPLADVSSAFEQAATFSEQLCIVAEKVDSKKGSTSECSAASPFKGAPSSPVPVQSDDIFSTPQRKRIYSAFTFSSPSPSSKRYAAARGSNVQLAN